jgi:hypothetical protein
MENFADADRVPDGPEGDSYGLLVSLFRTNVPVLPADAD